VAGVPPLPVNPEPAVPAVDMPPEPLVPSFSSVPLSEHPRPPTAMPKAPKSKFFTFRHAVRIESDFLGAGSFSFAFGTQTKQLHENGPRKTQCRQGAFVRSRCIFETQAA
jgi:hypothetical protein